MRVFVLSHPFEPHQAATPLMLGGMAPTTTYSSMGAHLQRYYRGFEPERRTPHAYTLYSSDTEIAAQFDIHIASASGLHPSWARPLTVRMVPNNPLSGLLSRTHLDGWQTQTDAAVDAYLEQYRAGLMAAGRDLSIDAPGMAELRIARDSLRISPELAGVLTADRLKAVPGSECGQTNDSLDTTRMGVQLGAQLLLSEQHRAQSVTYIDSGLINAAGAGYDTHDNHIASSSLNVVHLCRVLSETINAPGENDPTKLDLDRHMIMLTTEFGRTPKAEHGKPLGLNHWPFGFVSVVIGGPVVQDNAGIVGAISDYPAAEATSGLNTTEFRAALLMGMGVWPFEAEAFGVGGIRGAYDRAEATDILRKMWGYS